MVGVVGHAFAVLARNEGSRTGSGLRLAFAGSLVGTALSVTVHTIIVPRNPGLFVLFGGWVFPPYIPLVFGPAAIAPGVLFILATDLVRDARANTLLVAGAVGLFAVAGIGPPFRSPSRSGRGLMAWAMAAG